MIVAIPANRPANASGSSDRFIRRPSRLQTPIPSPNAIAYIAIRWPSPTAISGAGLQNADSAAQAASSTRATPATITAGERRSSILHGAKPTSRIAPRQSKIVPGSTTTGK